MEGLLAHAFRDRPRVSAESTGDRDLRFFLQQHLGDEQHEVSAFVLHGTETDYGGLGTGHTDEFEIASITGTFTAELLRIRLEDGDITVDTTGCRALGDGEVPVCGWSAFDSAGHVPVRGPPPRPEAAGVHLVPR